MPPSAGLNHSRSTVLERYIAKEPSKIYFSETRRPRANCLCMQQCLVAFYTNPANHAPGVQFDYAPRGHSLP